MEKQIERTINKVIKTLLWLVIMLCSVAAPTHAVNGNLGTAVFYLFFSFFFFILILIIEYKREL